MRDLSGDVRTHPADPPAAWLGGKRQLAKTICRRFAEIPHQTYVEPFVGMGGVFFRKPFAAPCEVINDINGEVINLFRILQRHYPQFMDCLKFQIASRKEFERLRAVDPATLTATTIRKNARMIIPIVFYYEPVSSVIRRYHTAKAQSWHQCFSTKRTVSGWA